MRRFQQVTLGAICSSLDRHSTCTRAKGVCWSRDTHIGSMMTLIRAFPIGLQVSRGTRIVLHRCQMDHISGWQPNSKVSDPTLHQCSQPRSC